jgi:hypothetical protein
MLLVHTVKGNIFLSKKKERKKEKIVENGKRERETLVTSKGRN